MYDEELEKAMLYYLIFEQEETQELKLKIDDFLNTRNRQIYKAIEELRLKKEEVNIISIKEKIKGKDTEILEYISRIAESKYGTSLEYTYKKIKEFTKRRETLKINKETLERVEKAENIEILIEKEIKKLQEINTEDKKERTFKEIVVDTSNILEKKIKEGSRFRNRYMTGIFDLDSATNGLHEEELTIIGARPGTGKTTLALKIAYNIAIEGVKVAIVSLEMSDIQLTQKMISRLARVDSNSIRNGTLTEEDLTKVSEATTKIFELPIFINTKARNIQEIEAYARRLKNK